MSGGQDAEAAAWSGAQAAGITADEHLGAAREAIRLFGDRLRPFDHDTEILPGVHIVDAAGHTPGHSAVLLQAMASGCSAWATCPTISCS